MVFVLISLIVPVFIFLVLVFLVVFVLIFYFFLILVHCVVHAIVCVVHVRCNVGFFVRLFQKVYGVFCTRLLRRWIGSFLSLFLHLQPFFWADQYFSSLRTGIGANDSVFCHVVDQACGAAVANS